MAKQIFHQELNLSVSIAPKAASWPEANTARHWELLHGAVDVARNAVRQAAADIELVADNDELTDVARLRRIARIALAAIDSLRENNALARARAAVETVVERAEERVGKSVTAPSNVNDALLAQEIRAYVAKQKSKSEFVLQHLENDAVISAVLNAPAFLSGLSDAEFNAIQHRVNTTMAPDAVKAKALAEAALEHVELGWRAAEERIAKLGQLRQATPGGEYAAAPIAA